MFDLNLNGQWIVTRDTKLGGDKPARFSSPEELTRTWQITMDPDVLNAPEFSVACVGFQVSAWKFVASQTVAWRAPSHATSEPGQNTSPIVGLIIPHPEAHEFNRRRPMLLMMQTTPKHYTISWVGQVTGLGPASADGSPQQIVSVEGIYFDADGVQSNFKMERGG